MLIIHEKYEQMNKTQVIEDYCTNSSQCMKAALANYQDNWERMNCRNVRKRINLKRTWIRQVILHVKTMQNYHLAQTTHNTKDTDKVHGLLYTGVLFCLHSHPFIAFGYACVLILQTQDFHFRSRATSQFHLITLVDSIQVFLIKELFDVGLFSGRDKRQTWVLDLFEGMLKRKLALLHKKLNYLEIASCACKKKKRRLVLTRQQICLDE